MSPPARHQTPNKRGEVSERKNTSLQIEYKKEIILGKTNKDYTKTEDQKAQKDKLKKASSILKNTNELLNQGNDFIKKVRVIDDIVDANNMSVKVIYLIEYYISRRRWLKADEICKNQFITVSKKMKIKGVLSVWEIKRGMKSRSKFTTFCTKYRTLAKYIGKAKSYLDVGEKAIKYYSSFKNKVIRGKKSKKDMSEAAKIRKEFMSVKKDMNIVMTLCKDMASIAPPGMKEYIEFNAKAFKAVDAILGIIDKYCQNIEKELGAFGKLEKAMLGKKSYYRKAEEVLKFDKLEEGIGVLNK